MEIVRGGSETVVNQDKSQTATVRHIFEAYSHDQLEYFFQRALQEEEYEMCGQIKQMLGNNFHPYFTAA